MIGIVNIAVVVVVGGGGARGSAFVSRVDVCWYGYVESFA